MKNQNPNFEELSILDQIETEFQLKEQAETMETLEALDSLNQSINGLSIDLENPENILKKVATLKEALSKAEKVLPAGNELTNLLQTINYQLERFEKVFERIEKMLKDKGDKKSEIIAMLRANEAFMNPLNENFASLQESLNLLSEYTKAHTSKDDELVKKTLETLKAIDKDGKMDNLQRQFEKTLNSISYNKKNPIKGLLKEWIQSILQEILELAPSDEVKYKILGIIQKDGIEDNIPKILKHINDDQKAFFQFSLKNFYYLTDTVATIYSVVPPDSMQIAQKGLVSLDTRERQTDYHIGQRIAFFRILSFLEKQSQFNQLPRLRRPISTLEDYSTKTTSSIMLFSKGSELQLIDIGSGDNLWLYSPDLEDPRNQEILKGYREIMDLFEKQNEENFIETTPEGLRSQIASLYKDYEDRKAELESELSEKQTAQQQLESQKARQQAEFESRVKELELKLAETKAELQQTKAELQQTKTELGRTKYDSEATISMASFEERKMKDHIGELKSRVDDLKAQTKKALDILENGNSFGKKGDTIKSATDILSQALIRR